MMYRISYGLGGGYNMTETEEVEANSLLEAHEMAYQAALEMFESYGVFENQRGDEEFENVDEREAAYMEEFESWADYYAEELN